MITRCDSLSSTTPRERILLAALWLLAFAAISIWIAFDHAGWDLVIYHNAIRSLHLGHDPYADAIAIQDQFHRTLAQHPNAVTPFSYVYSPITLPVLRLIEAIPAPLAAILYWLLYIASALALVWVGLQGALPREQRFFLYFAPAAVFFPGLLHHDTILSGNIAIILYALVLSAAIPGWRRNRWILCYVAILIASCFKPPLLTLLAIPLFSARRQLLPAAITAAASILLFAVQPLLWPSLFRNFLHAIALQFVYNHDFGCSPSGLLSSLLVAHRFSYSPWSTIFYLLYAPALEIALFICSRRYLSQQLTLQQWMPVLLVGVILLDPRIMQYDTLALTIPLLLILWRVLRRFMSQARTVAALCIFFAPANFAAVQSLEMWKYVEGPLLVAVFLAGCLQLQQILPEAQSTDQRDAIRR